MFDIDKNREFKEKVIDNDFNLKFQFTEIVKYISNLEQENTQLKQQLKDKDEKISKAIDHINETGMICACGQDSYEKLQNDILNILESNKED